MPCAAGGVCLLGLTSSSGNAPDTSERSVVPTTISPEPAVRTSTTNASTAASIIIIPNTDVLHEHLNISQTTAGSINDRSDRSVPTNTTPTAATTSNGTAEEALNNGSILPGAYDTADPLHRSHHLPAAPTSTYAIAILSLSIVVFSSSTLVLIATRFTSGGRSATLVFLRSLCLSDILMSTYGVSKMAMLLCMEDLHVNFFLPESLFFTASLASTMSLLSLNVDCFVKLTRPLEYAQVDKDTVITGMLLLWNVAFIVGFLPLLGWNLQDFTVYFFSFFPWHYLLFNGLVMTICVLICIACMVALARLPSLPAPEPDCFTARGLEVRKYRRLHRTIVMESGMWLCCYLPFFLYLGLACPQCPLSHYPYRDSAVLYFIPVFLVKSLLSSALQAVRTLHVHAIMNRLLADFSVMRHLRRMQTRGSGSEGSGERGRERPAQPKSAGETTISYINPLCSDDEGGGENHHQQNRSITIIPHRHNDYHQRHHHHRYPNNNNNNNNNRQSFLNQQRRRPQSREDHDLTQTPTHNHQQLQPLQLQLQQHYEQQEVHHQQQQQQQRQKSQSRFTVRESDFLLHQAISDSDLTDLTHNSDTPPSDTGSRSSPVMGIVNLAFRESIDLGHQTLDDVPIETTAL